MAQSVAYCKFDVSWELADNKDIAQVAVYRSEDGEGSEGSTLQSIGLHLEAPSENTHSGNASSGNVTVPPCTIEITTRRPPYNVAISAVDVLCSARNMEVYCETGEYVSTSHGVWLQDVEGEDQVYMLQHSFDHPVNMCKLKFVSLQKTGELWVHSVHVTVCGFVGDQPPHPAYGTVCPTIDVEKVKAMMGDLNMEVPHSAQGLMHTIEMFQQNKQATMAPFSGLLGGPTGNPNMPAMLAMFAGMRMQGQGQHQGDEGVGERPYEGPRAETDQGDIGDDEDSECMESVPSTHTSSHRKGAVTHSKTNVGHRTESESQTTQTDGQTIFNSHILELETRLLNHIDRKFQETEQRIQLKLDRILNTLQGAGTSCDRQHVSDEGGFELD